MKEFLKNPKFKNPYLWLSLIALMFGAAGIDFNTLTSWELFGEAALSILRNPVAIVAVITVILGVWNDNSTSGMDKFKIKNKEE